AVGGVANGQTTNTTSERIGPMLSVNIPDLTFGRIVNGAGMAGAGTTAQNYIDVPWISNYIAAVYRYAITIATVLAGVMFVVGGFQYVTAGGDAGRVQKGKQRITDALIGLLLTFGAFIILLTINPDLVSLTSLQLLSVKKLPLSLYSYADPQSPNGQYQSAMVASGGPSGTLTASEAGSMPPPYTALSVPPASTCKSQAIPQSLRDDFMRQQLKTGVPAAVSLAQWAVESGYGKSCIGPPDKKFNCGGIKCSSGGKYAGMDTLQTNPRPTCPANCLSVATTERRPGSPPNPPVLDPYWSCFQIIDNFDQYHQRHDGIVQRLSKGGWSRYNGNPEGFADFLQAGGYATAPNYAKVLKQVMKRECLVGA
ncbi:MAG: hypothetical protein RL272_1040, partial [Candidatus Parcubacteria bacterium]